MNINQMLTMQQQRKPDILLNNVNTFQQGGGNVRPSIVNNQAHQQQQQQQPQTQFNPQFTKSPSPSAQSPVVVANGPTGLVHLASHVSQMVPSPAMAPSPQMLSMQGGSQRNGNI